MARCVTLRLYLQRLTVRNDASNRGVSLAEQPTIAESFSRLATNQIDSGGETIRALRSRADNVNRIDIRGSESNLDIFGTAADSWKSGSGGV